jgi:hypothetical protein
VHRSVTQSGTSPTQGLSVGPNGICSAMIDYNDLSDPDEYILKICDLLLCGDNKTRYSPKLTISQRHGKFEVVIDLVFMDADQKHKVITRKVEAGEGYSVAMARAELLKKLVARAQAVIDLPVQQVMES